MVWLFAFLFTLATKFCKIHACRLIFPRSVFLHHLLPLFYFAQVNPASYNSFRYGLVLLYLGTLLTVIGYHNGWIAFIRYVGFGLAGAGLVCVAGATYKSCSGLSRAQAVSIPYCTYYKARLTKFWNARTFLLIRITRCISTIGYKNNALVRLDRAVHTRTVL